MVHSFKYKILKTTIMITKEMLTINEKSSFLGLHYLDGTTNYIFMATIEVSNNQEQSIILKKGEFSILYLENKAKGFVSTKEKSIEIESGKMFKFKIGLQLTSETAFAKGKITLSTLDSKEQTIINLNTMYLASSFTLN